MKLLDHHILSFLVSLWNEFDGHNPTCMKFLKYPLTMHRLYVKVLKRGSTLTKMILSVASVEFPSTWRLQLDFSTWDEL